MTQGARGGAFWRKLEGWMGCAKQHCHTWTFPKGLGCPVGPWRDEQLFPTESDLGYAVLSMTQSMLSTLKSHL